MADLDEQWHFRPYTGRGEFSTSTLCGWPIILLGEGVRRKFLTTDPDWVSNGPDDCPKCAMLISIAQANGFDLRATDIEEKLEAVLGRIRI